jgi:hypothetical protein
MITQEQKKAKELVQEFMSIDSDSEQFDGFKMRFFYAQRCALIAVNEIIKSNPRLPQTLDWQKVKTEIEKL